MVGRSIVTLNLTKRSNSGAFRYRRGTPNPALPSVLLSSNPNHVKGRRMRDSIANGPRSHADSTTPIVGTAHRRVSLSGCIQSVADADSDHSTTPTWFCGQGSIGLRAK